MAWNAQALAPRFAENLERWGEAPALITTAGLTITYRDLAARADAFAQRLTPELRLLAIEVRNSLEPVVAYLAALRAGVPVILHESGAAGRRVTALCPPDAIYRFDEATCAWALTAAPTPWARAPHPELAVLLSTSGSTGSGKLIKLSSANLQANANSIASYLDLDPSERAITTLPLFYSYGLSILNSHLDAGASVVLTEESVSSGPFRRLLEKHGVTSLAGVPYSYELMERCGLLANLPRSVRTLTQAGGRMAPAAVQRIAAQLDKQGARLFVMYGQTEATARMAYLDPSELKAHAEAIGRAIPGGELWVEGADGRRAAIGEEGELVYRGRNVMMGYAARRTDLPAAAQSNRLQTGDMAVEVEPGLFRITGRKSRFVKPFGLRVSLDELEARYRARGIETVIAGDDHLIVVATDGADGADRTVLDELALPDELFQFVGVDVLPRLRSGKPDYPEIVRLGRESRAAEDAASGIEAVEVLFRRLARGRPVANSTSFEELGGDSLSYVECSIAIEAALGALPDEWEVLPLSDLRERARRAKPRNANWMTIESDVVVRAGAIMLVLFQHALNGLQGGAVVLMMLAGFSWARFQRPRLLRGDAKGAIWDFTRRYLLIYIAIMIAVFAQNGSVYPDHLFFVSTFFSDLGGILNTYWFIESLTWCVFIICGALLIPGVRSLFQKRPVLSALGLVAVALAVRGIGVELDAPARYYRSPDQVLLFFAAGWAIALCGRSLQIALFALLGVALGLAWGWSDTHVLAMAAAGLMLVCAPRIVLPKLIGRAVTFVASASFYIYLLNPIPMYVTDDVLHSRWGKYWIWQILATLALGSAAYLASGYLERGAWKPWRPAYGLRRVFAR